MKLSIKNKCPLIAIFAFLFLAIFVLAYFSVYEINDGEQGLLLKSSNGKSALVKIANPGLLLVNPFHTRVKKIAILSNTVIAETVSVNLLHNERLLFDYYIHWSVADTEKYLLNFDADNSRVETFLRREADDRLREYYANRSLANVTEENSTGELKRVMKQNLYARFIDLGILVDDFEVTNIAKEGGLESVRVIAAREVKAKELVTEKKREVDAEVDKMAANTRWAARKIYLDTKIKIDEIYKRAL